MRTTLKRVTWEKFTCPEFAHSTGYIKHLNAQNILMHQLNLISNCDKAGNSVLLLWEKSARVGGRGSVQMKTRGRGGEEKKSSENEKNKKLHKTLGFPQRGQLERQTKLSDTTELPPL